MISAEAAYHFMRVNAQRRLANEITVDEWYLNVRAILHARYADDRPCQPGSRPGAAAQALESRMSTLLDTRWFEADHSQESATVLAA